MNAPKSRPPCWLVAAGLAMLLSPPWSILAAADRASPIAFRTAAVTRGDLVVTVGATGTLEAENVFDVGAQVVGRIERLGLDPRGKTDAAFKGKSIDLETPVEDGTVLAQINDAAYVAQVEQARAGCTKAEAELAQAKAKAELAEAEWRRAQTLLKSNAMSASDVEVLRGQ